MKAADFFQSFFFATLPFCVGEWAIIAGMGDNRQNDSVGKMVALPEMDDNRQNGGFANDAW